MIQGFSSIQSAGSPNATHLARLQRNSGIFSVHPFLSVRINILTLPKYVLCYTLIYPSKTTSDIVHVNTWEFVVMSCENIYGIGFNAILLLNMLNMLVNWQRDWNVCCCYYCQQSNKQTFFKSWKKPNNFDWQLKG